MLVKEACTSSFVVTCVQCLYWPTKSLHKVDRCIGQVPVQHKGSTDLNYSCVTCTRDAALFIDHLAPQMGPQMTKMLAVRLNSL
jgi:hypothetical protein